MNWMPEGLIDLALAVAGTDEPLLIVGEAGVGKETLARKIHALSPKAQGPFVEINCGALSPGLLHGVMFGDDPHVKLADAVGGTFYLSAFGDLPLEVQRDLLIRSPQRVFAEVRLIADTNRDLAEMVARGWCLPELAAWISQRVVRIPPLRERRSEIPAFARAFVAEFAQKMSRPLPEISPEALGLLDRHTWPGNVRELSNYIQRALVLSPSGSIEAAHLPLR